MSSLFCLWPALVLWLVSRYSANPQQGDQNGDIEPVTQNQPPCRATRATGLLNWIGQAGTGGICVKESTSKRVNQRLLGVEGVVQQCWGYPSNLAVTVSPDRCFHPLGSFKVHLSAPLVVWIRLSLQGMQIKCPLEPRDLQYFSCHLPFKPLSVTSEFGLLYSP